MRQILVQVPVLWLAVAALAIGAATLVFGLVRRSKETSLTGVLMAGAGLPGFLFFRAGWLPIFGFGTMLFFAFLAANWIGTRAARRDGMAPETLVDMGLWIFIWGIIGARALFMVRNPSQFDGPLAFFKIWQGGIVFYGGVITGVLVFFYYTRRYKLPPFRVLDVFAPALAIGIAVGRIGCHMNGCCWGAPTELPWAVEFPYGSIPHLEQLYDYDYRVSLGFHFSRDEGADPVISSVDDDSWAATAGLKAGDTVRRVGNREVVRVDRGREFRDGRALLGLMGLAHPGENLPLEVDRNGDIVTISGIFSPVPPHSLPVHPTQLYLALAGFGLLGLTLAYFPRRRRPGEVMALLMVGYAVTRFGIEYLRDDELPWADGLTISQNISVLLFVGGIVLFGYLRQLPRLEPSVRVEPQRVDKTATRHDGGASLPTTSRKSAALPS